MVGVTRERCQRGVGCRHWTPCRWGPCREGVQAPDIAKDMTRLSDRLEEAFLLQRGHCQVEGCGMEKDR
eukprot:12884329-Prorocentrum_lima.AAC.1